MTSEPTHRVAAEVAGLGARISATLGANALALGQPVPLHVRIDLDPGLHVYRAPVPEGFVATEVAVSAPAGLTVDPPRYPPAHPFRVEGIDHEFAVMDGRVEIAVPLTLTVAEGAPLRVAVSVRYQACDDRQCFIPRTETLHLVLPRNGGARPLRR